MGEKLVLDENIFYKAIMINENKHDECYKLVEIIDEMKHKLVCDRNLLKRYGERIENIPNDTKVRDEITMGKIHMMLLTKEDVIIVGERYKRKVEKEHKYLVEQMKKSFNAHFKQNAKSNKEDLEIAKLAIISNCSGKITYALITEDTEFYKWMKDFLGLYSENYKELEKTKVLNSKESLEDEKINLKN